GFSLSATKDIIENSSNKNMIGKITGNVILSKLILSIISYLIIFLLIFSMDILQQVVWFTLLSQFVVLLSSFLVDFLFRGLEKMHIITFCFLAMKGISTVLTFVFVHSDNGILWIPFLDIFGTIVAIIITLNEIKKLGIRIQITKFIDCFRIIRISATYFISNISTTAFGALNTIIIGIYIDPVQVALWSVTLQIVSGIQSVYTPIIDGIYPTMIQTKNLYLIKKILKLMMPVIVLGCVFSFFIAKYIFLILGGSNYVEAVPIFRCLVPVLLFSFPGMLLGWPTLGAINKAEETTKTTVIAAVVQVLGLIFLILFNSFNLIEIAILRSVTEFLMMTLRAFYVFKYKNMFNK
ncbi:MAG: oligosaccharide flippase family protein, partial [Eubacterium sp.]